jgi:hypothetical protein
LNRGAARRNPWGIRNPELETTMYTAPNRTASLLRGLCGAASLVVTLGIVFSLDALSNHYSAATVAKAPAAVVVVASR